MISDTLDEPSIALQNWKSHVLSDSRAWEFRGECGHQTATNLKLWEPRRSTERGGRDADMKEEERVRLKFEYTESVRNIQAWKAHLLWSRNQDERIKGIGF